MWENTESVVAFPLQQWLYKRATLLPYTLLAYLVLYMSMYCGRQENGNDVKDGMTILTTKACSRRL
jgi:hypothetical protein